MISQSSASIRPKTGRRSNLTSSEPRPRLGVVRVRRGILFNLNLKKHWKNTQNREEPGSEERSCILRNSFSSWSARVRLLHKAGLHGPTFAVVEPKRSFLKPQCQLLSAARCFGHNTAHRPFACWCPIMIMLRYDGFLKLACKFLLSELDPGRAWTLDVLTFLDICPTKTRRDIYGAGRRWSGNNQNS